MSAPPASLTDVTLSRTLELAHDRQVSFGALVRALLNRINWLEPRVQALRGARP